MSSVGQQGLCDLATASCSSVPALGQHFWPSVGLRCRVRQDGHRRWTIAPATYRSETEVQCHLPVAILRRLRHRAEVVPWTVEVSTQLSPTQTSTRRDQISSSSTASSDIIYSYATKKLKAPPAKGSLN